MPFRAHRVDLAQLLVHDSPAALCLLNKQLQTPLDLLPNPEALLECVRFEPIKMKDDDAMRCMLCKTPFGIKLRKVGQLELLIIIAQKSFVFSLWHSLWK
jgi:hypothetical protein